MKIKTGKHTAFEVEFYAESFLGRRRWLFRLPTIEVARLNGEIGVCVFAFFWNAGVSIEKVKEE